MMGTGLTNSSQKRSLCVRTALVAAAFEWILICLLFVHAMFSYLITKFASYAELQIPCLLCSRLDHVFGNKGLKFYWELFCRHHKIEISSLFFCQSHNNLVDVHETCESCRSSYDVHGQATSRCACCSESWIPKAQRGKMTVTKSVGSGTEGLDEPFLHVVGRNLDNQQESKSEILISDNIDAKKLVRENKYTEDEIIVTLPDDSPSEKLMDPVSARQPSIAASLEQSDVINSHCIASMPLGKEIQNGLEELNWNQADHKADDSIVSDLIDMLADSSPSEKLMDPVSARQPSITASLEQSDIFNSHDLAAIPLDGNGLEELNWNQSDHKADDSIVSDLISVNEVSVSDAKDTVEEETEESKCISIDDVSVSSLTRETTMESKPVFDFDVLPSSNSVESPVQEMKEIDVAETKEDRQRSEMDNDEKCKMEESALTKSVEVDSETNPSSVDNGLQASSLDLSDAYKLAIGNRERQLSGVLEQLINKDSSKLSEDLKLLMSQLSAAREQSMSPRVPISPKVSLTIDDLKSPDASGTIGMQILQKRISLERNESGLSLDGSNVSEIEGESLVDRLRRQVEHDKKLLYALYKELEEERNASAVAANQAMAMITKLQEEKAALHMEALQCLRVMEEQAEYEMEALQRKDELLAEKEQEIQDLEAEIKLFKSSSPSKAILVDSDDPATGNDEQLHD